MIRFSRYVSGVGMVLAGAVLAGCASPPRYSAPVTSNSPTGGYTPATVKHQYTIQAVDSAGAPLSGVEVAVKLSSKGASADKGSTCVTDATGRCEPVSLDVAKDPSYTYVTSYASTADVKGTKEGYYDAKTKGYLHDSTKKDNEQTVKLRMLKPLDYLDDSLANSPADKELRGRVLRFLEVIKLQSLLTDSEVMLKGVGTSEFKGKKYLRLRVNSDTVYNSLKLDKYAIGKQLYDEVVRKLLNPLNDHIAAPKAYFGYDIVVYGYTKNLTEKYATPTKIEYRFLLPESAVRRYKDKDISGQALLDAGVILMDDERVEFKLQ